MRTKLIAALAFAAALVLPAHAEDGAWKVGNSYVIRFQHLDLAQPQDRQALLVQVERSATRLCKTVRAKARRQACVDNAISTSLASSNPAVRSAVQTARLERNSTLQAQR